jgi:hypothetical protein
VVVGSNSKGFIFFDIHGFYHSLVLFFSFFIFIFIFKLMVKHLTFTNLKSLDGVFHKFLSLFQSKGQPKNLSNWWAIEDGEKIYCCPLTNYN